MPADGMSMLATAERAPVLTLSPDPTSVKVARTFVHDTCLAAGVAATHCDTAVLLTSEVVTNAILHGRSDARVRMAVVDGRIAVLVGDDNSRHPAPVITDDHALDGRGLAILDLLADEWGVRDDDYGKTVWFVLAHTEAVTT